MNIVKMTGRLFLPVFLGIELLACNQNNVVPDPTPSSANVQAMRASMSSLEGNWVLTNYKNNPLPSALQNRATLVFQDKSGDSIRVGGRSFINHYGGKFEINEQKGLIVSTTDFISTMMGGSDEDMRAETQFIERLSKATFFELPSSNQLQLYLGSKDKPSEIMYFTRK
ncbi:hypothetical protein GCM10028807_43190 [Spirosoma daeguense]